MAAGYVSRARVLEDYPSFAEHKSMRCFKRYFSHHQANACSRHDNLA